MNFMFQRVTEINLIKSTNTETGRGGSVGGDDVQHGVILTLSSVMVYSCLYQPRQRTKKLYVSPNGCI
jgi:hypothetical protein